MLIIADKRLPEKALDNLNSLGEVVCLETTGITYEAISGHPDIFFCQVNNQLIVAPNIPPYVRQILEKNKVSVTYGEERVGGKYPATAGYNAAFTGRYLIHNFRYTDSMITRHAEEVDLIHVNQGYCRCNLLPLRDDHYITSDEGMQRVLKKYNFKVLYVNPHDILLPWAKHGFFGGCCGIAGNTVYIIGSLANFSMGDEVRTFLQQLNYTVVELYQGPLIDGGSLVFID